PVCLPVCPPPTFVFTSSPPPLPPPHPSSSSSSSSSTRPGTPVVSPGQTDIQRQLPSGLQRLPEAMRWTRPMAAAAPARAYPIC
ncbi:hypothetical protein COCMIDRAFT_101379, partial [Bipolaris oryzae ATCC 44560]